MKKKVKASRVQKKARVRRTYVVQFRVEIEQDEAGDDMVFDAENSIRVDLECLQNQNGSDDGHIKYLEVSDVGAQCEES